MKTKRITLKAIESEIGPTDFIKATPQQAFLLVLGTERYLMDTALAPSTPYDEVVGQSNAALRKLAKKLFGWQSRGTRFNVWAKNRW